MNKTPQQIVMDSVVSLPPDAVKRCSKCGTLATCIWPAVSRDPSLFCNECLSKAQKRLAVALGASSGL